MTKTAAVYTDQSDSEQAGRHLGSQVRDQFDGEVPDALILFASSRFDHVSLLKAVTAECRPALLVGSSSAGEFTGTRQGTGTASALAIRSTAMRLSAGLGRHVTRDRSTAVRDVVAQFRGLGTRQFPFRSALILTDALAGHADDLVEELTVATSGQYQFAGGGAGDDAKFAKTHVFFGEEVHADAVVALEILSSKPLGIGVGHGWTPAGNPLRVTEADGFRLVGLNGLPAADAFADHAQTTGQLFDRRAPLPFFLHNILGIDTGSGHRLRVPLSVTEDGSVDCAAEIPSGARVHIMKTTADSAITAARQATESAVRALGAAKPGAALFFDCVATRLRMGDAFGFELGSVAEALGDARLVGCNTYGQIARAEGQFGGFHNCTAVVMVLPAND